MWGWATWRRAWAKYDLDMTRWPEIRDRQLFDQYFPNRRERYYWESNFQMMYDGGKIDTWDYQWFYSMWENSGLCITPARNLVRNIGIDAEATHTNTKYDRIYLSLRAGEMETLLTHPANVLANSDHDKLEARLRFSYHTKGMLGLFFRLLAVKVLVRRMRTRVQSGRAHTHEG